MTGSLNVTRLGDPRVESPDYEQGTVRVYFANSREAALLVMTEEQLDSLVHKAEAFLQDQNREESHNVS